jgi:hypothetical protein
MAKIMAIGNMTDFTIFSLHNVDNVYMGTKISRYLELTKRIGRINPLRTHST